MSMHVFTPRRSQPAPVAGTFVSLTAHAALVATVAMGDASPIAGARAPADAPPAPAPLAPEGERLHWVGLGDGHGSGMPRRRPGARPTLPPIAYVVPGRGGALGPGVPGRTAAGARAPAPDARRPAAPTTPAVRRAPTVAPPKLTLPEAAFRDAGATVLIAGVVSAARDLARRASRPEDFVPEPPAKLAAELLVHTGVYLPAVMRPNLHVDDLPVPLVGNPPPAYPASLERARVGGQVVVEFRIDSTGAVDEGSLRVVRSTDALFTQAVRGVLPRLRFVPAQLGQRAVGITVQQPFVFTVRSGL